MTDPPKHPIEDIGFPDTRDAWRHAEVFLDGQRLEILGHPVMQAWEVPYMKELARIATSRGGRILEVGFGMGLSAAAIQEHEIAEHVIIEPNLQIFERLLDLARGARVPVRPELGFWEEIVPDLEDESFDGILFDPYPITATQLHGQRFSFFGHAARLLRPGGVFTHYAGETEFTTEYRRHIETSGRWEYAGWLVPVSPPAGCIYWSQPHILAPRFIKPSVRVGSES